MLVVYAMYRDFNKSSRLAAAHLLPPCPVLSLPAFISLSIRHPKDVDGDRPYHPLLLMSLASDLKAESILSFISHSAYLIPSRCAKCVLRVESIPSKSNIFAAATTAQALDNPRLSTAAMC